MNLVFDLDGTLVDSWPAHLAAYNSIGVDPPPEGKFLPASVWLKNEELHRRKQECFAKYAGLIRELPLMDLYKKAGGTILTGASPNSVITIMSALDIHFPIRFTGLNQEQKLFWLNDIGSGIYFDDDLDFLSRVETETNWQVINACMF